MQNFDDIDDQLLSAFVDGQLDAAHCEWVIHAMENDPQVRQRVYRLRRAKDLMKLGFGNARAPVPVLPEVKTGGWRPSSFSLTASILILVAALGSGWLGYLGGNQLADRSTNGLAPMARQNMDRVILHVSESNPQQFSAVLAYTKKFLEKHKKNSGQIAVIANAGGLDLLRTGVSPYEEQIVALIREHDNVHFIACASSIGNLRKKGVDPKIIDKIDTTLPAMDQIIRHVQQGWFYIKVDTLINI